MKLKAVGLVVAGALVIGGGSLTNADLPKRAGESAKLEYADGDEKTFAFEMRDKSWRQVFQWYVDNSDQEIIAPIKLKGSFTFIPPKGRRYTLTEIRDILNERLLADHMLLVPGPRACVLVNLEDLQREDGRRRRIPAELPAKLGRFDYVEVLVKLTALDGKDVEDLAQETGKYGDLVVLEVVNKVVVRGLSSDVRPVVAKIQDRQNRRAEQLCVAHKIIRHVEKSIEVVKWECEAFRP